MDFTKFVWMLENSALFFSSVDRLGDPFEGSMSELEDREFSAAYDQTVRNAARYHTVTFSRRRVMVSCWHLSAHESMAMWKIYAAGGKAIAVQSTFEALTQAVSHVVAGVGIVNYIDHETGRTHEHPFYSPYMHKRVWYNYESEVRALLYNRDQQIPEGGMSVKVDLSNLIKSVIVAPGSEGLIDLTRRVVARHGLEIPVHPSSLDSSPRF
jgi:hypothetical protein